MRWRKERWERRTAAGALVAGMALGLRDVLEAEQESEPIIVDHAGDPPTPKVTLYFHPDVPEATLALVWASSSSASAASRRW